MRAAADTPRAFPWREVLHTGLCLLRLSPSDLWAMSLPEFSIACGMGSGPATPVADARMLGALMARYPNSP